MNLDDLERIGKEAVPAPWKVNFGVGLDYGVIMNADTTEWVGALAESRAVDLQFIVNARNFWDRLIAVAKAAELCLVPLNIPDGFFPDTAIRHLHERKLQYLKQAMASLKDEK